MLWLVSLCIPTHTDDIDWVDRMGKVNNECGEEIEVLWVVGESRGFNVTIYIGVE